MTVFSKALLGGSLAAGSYVLVIQVLKAWRAAYMDELVEKALEGKGSIWRVHNLLTANELRLEAWLAMSARGLLLTYSIPSISSVLAKTGGFERDVHRRYADMELLIREFSENAADGTAEGQPTRALTAIQRLNAIHNQYGSLILQGDLKFVLTVFMCTPATWCGAGVSAANGGGIDSDYCHRWACRCFTPREIECVFRHWVNIGKLMQIEGLEEWTSFADALAFKRAYEKKYQRFSEPNKRVAFATIEYFLCQFPAGWIREGVRPNVLQTLSAMQESDEHAAALGLPHPHPLLRLAVDVALSVRAFVWRVLLPPLPLACTDRLTGVDPIGEIDGEDCKSASTGTATDSDSAAPRCPFRVFAPSRPLDFNNPTYSPSKGYAIEHLGPPSVQKGLLVSAPRYAGGVSR